MRPVSEVFERHPLVHAVFSVGFFAGVVLVARMLPGLEGLSVIPGFVVGGLAFLSSRAQMRSRR